MSYKHALAILVALAALAALAVPASAVAISDAGHQAKAGRQAALEFGTLSKVPLRLTPKELAEHQEDTSDEDENARRVPTPVGVVPGPSRTASGDPTAQPSVFAPLVANPLAGAAAATDFTVWRSQPTGAGSATVSEPSWANDRNAILYTGNWGAAVSPDNGMTWSFVSPGNLQPTVPSPELDAGFCCDQNVLAVDRGGYSLILWVQQTTADSDGNHIRLAIYQGRDELLSQSNFCIKDWEPKDFGLGAAKFDFSYIASTSKNVYISANVNKLSGGFKSGVVWRIPISQLDSSNCNISGVHYWTSATDWGTALAQGSGSTMYWAYHSPNSGKLDVWSVPDGSNTATEHVVNITNYATTDRGDGRSPAMICGRNSRAELARNGRWPVTSS